MKIKGIVFVILAALAAAAIYRWRAPITAWFMPSRAAQTQTAPVDHSAHAAQASKSAERRILYWQDPMHPAYRSDKPGIAPDCGMQLVPVYSDEMDMTAKMPPGTVHLSAERQQLIGVKLGHAELQPVGKTIRAVARISYDERRIAHVHSKVEGWIDKVFVDYAGASVKQGEPLFTLYSPDLLETQQEFLLALRARKILAQSPTKEVANSTTTLYEAARKRLELWDMSDVQIRRIEETGQPEKDITFYSPHSGFVVERKAFQHQRVTTDMEIYTIADLSQVWAIADIYEAEAPMVHLGQSVRITLESLPGTVIHGRISYIFPQLDPQTRTLKVRVDLPNPGLRLRPEMFATAEIETYQGRQLVVPAEAVLDSGAQQYVFLAKGDGYFEQRQITAGGRSDGYYVVLSGLKPGDPIVISANFLIDSESRLKQAAAQMGGEQQHHH